jgi:hypothetical protein
MDRITGAKIFYSDQSDKRGIGIAPLPKRFFVGRDNQTGKLEGLLIFPVAKPSSKSNWLEVAIWQLVKGDNWLAQKAPVG